MEPFQLKKGITAERLWCLESGKWRCLSFCSCSSCVDMFLGLILVVAMVMLVRVLVVVVVVIVIFVLLFWSQVVKAELDVGAQVKSSGDLMPVLKMTNYLEAEDDDQSGAFKHFWFQFSTFTSKTREILTFSECIFFKFLVYCRFALMFSWNLRVTQLQ